jgi:hypothetical protein
VFNFPECPLPPGSRVIAYRRDSGGPRQDLASQRAFQQAYFEHYQLTVVHEFEDAAVSSKSTAGRNDFKRMMTLIQDSDPPLADAVVFWDYKRLSRNYDLGQNALSIIRLKGYLVINLSDYIPDTSEGRVLEALKLYVAQQENEDRARDIKRGHKFLMGLRDENGQYLGLWPRRAPQFFIVVPYDTGLKRNDGQPRIVGQLRPDPEKAPLVKRAFELRATGYNYADIEAVTQLFGPLSYQNKIARYRRLFKNPIYRGDFYCGGKWYYDYVPAIVDRDLWERANAVTTKGEAWNKNLSQPRAGTSKYDLLSGLCFCGLCDRRMFTKKGWLTRYYICSRRQRINWSACDNRCIRSDILEPAILDHVTGVFLSPQYIRSLIERVNDLLNASDIEAELERKLAEVSELSKRRDNLIELGEQSGSQAVLERLARVEADLKAAQRELETLTTKKRERQPIRVDGSVILALIAQTQRDLNGHDLRPKQVRLQRIIEKVEVVPDAATIHYLFPLPEAMTFSRHLLQQTWPSR